MNKLSLKPFLKVKAATVNAAKSERPRFTENASSVVYLIAKPPVDQSKTAARTNATGGKFLEEFIEFFEFVEFIEKEI